MPSGDLSGDNIDSRRVRLAASALNPPCHRQLHPRAAVSSWPLVPTLAPARSGAAAVAGGLSAERSASSESVLARGHAFRGLPRKGRAPSASRPPSRSPPPKRTGMGWATAPSETRPISEISARSGRRGPRHAGEVRGRGTPRDTGRQRADGHYRTNDAAGGRGPWDVEKAAADRDYLSRPYRDARGQRVRAGGRGRRRRVWG